MSRIYYQNKNKMIKKKEEEKDKICIWNLWNIELFLRRVKFLVNLQASLIEYTEISGFTCYENM